MQRREQDAWQDECHVHAQLATVRKYGEGMKVVGLDQP